MKVVWICPFDISLLKDKLKSENVNLPKILSPWITDGINAIKKEKDIEMHIVSMYKELFNDKFLNEKNIHYHLLSRPKYPIVNKTSYLIDYCTGFYLINKKINNTINKINPDIVNLHGTEHEMTSSILKLGSKYPAIVTIQGFMNDVFNQNPNKYNKRNLKVENKVFRKIKHYSIRAKFMAVIINKYNNHNPKYHWYNYHTKEILNYKQISKKDSDIVFAARICKDKGIEDLIFSLPEVKKKIPDIKLKIIGKGNENYIKYIKQKIIELGLSQNVILLGFIPSDEKMYKEIMKSRICVLPTYYDIIPGTIIESMKLSIPVIAYKVGGIPDLNDKNEVIRLVDVGNLDQLTKEIINLLSNESIMRNMAIKAKAEADKRFDNHKIMPLLRKAYEDVIFDFKKDKK